MSFKDIELMKDTFGIFCGHFFCKNYLINSIPSSIFGWLFLHFRYLLNEGQIFNFCKHFMMNSKISGFVGFTR